MNNFKNLYFEQVTRKTTAIAEFKINLSEGLKRSEIESLPGVEFEVNPLLTTERWSVCFGVTSRVDITVLDHSFVRSINSVV